MRRFDAPWDRALLLSTVFLLAVMLCASIAGFSTAAQEVDGRGVAAMVAIAGAGIAVAAWAFAPRAFEIGPGAVRILRNGWFGTAIPLCEIVTAGPLEPDALRGAVRLVGVGGLFGSYGFFRSRELGPMRLDTTRHEGLVLVRTARRAHVLTPERPAEFVEALLAAAPAAQRERRAAVRRRR